MSCAPDYRIKLATLPNGETEAVPPMCPDWRTVHNGPFQNEPWPQYGCANARNLAAMVEDPEDLIVGKELGPASGTVTAYSMKRYNEGKTTALIDPNADSPMQVLSSVASGDQGGGGQAGASQ
jgi:pilus assembly protein CpaD